MSKKYRRILILGDVHLPYPDWDTLEQAAEYNKTFNADLVIQMGDLVDAKAWGKYQTDPDDDSPELEWLKTEKAAAKLAKLFPEITILIGNHERRFSAKATEARLPAKLVKSYREALGIKGWSFHVCNKPLVIDTPKGKVAFIHGDEMGGPIKTKASRLGMSLVQGHTHNADLHYINTFAHSIFALDVGCTANLESKAMRYNAKNPITKWQGFAVISDGVPHLIPKK